jgi:hypothetical protein
VHQTSAPYTPQQNGVAEYANRTIVEMARSMLCGQGLGREFWAEAVSNVVYTHNQYPNKALKAMTPEEVWSSKKPCIAHMRVLGCIAFAKVSDEKRSKLDAKGIKCLFLGYCEGTKAYRLICMKKQKIIKSLDAVFFKDKGLLKEGPSGSVEDEAIDVDHYSKFEDEEDLEEKPKVVQQVEASTTQSKPSGVKEVAIVPPQQVVSSSEGVATMEDSRYPSRVRKPLGEWWMNHILPPRVEKRANLAFDDEPHTMSEAMQSGDAKKWEMAMQEEFDSLIANGT